MTKCTRFASHSTTMSTANKSYSYHPPTCSLVNEGDAPTISIQIPHSAMKVDTIHNCHTGTTKEHHFIRLMKDQVQALDIQNGMMLLLQVMVLVLIVMTLILEVVLLVLYLLVPMLGVLVLCLFIVDMIIKVEPTQEVIKLVQVWDG